MGHRILVVDDDSIVRHAVGQVLRRAGYDVVCACDGLEAVRALEASGAPVRAVVTDVHMPGSDGVELLRALRRAVPRVPVIAMSGGGALPASTSLEILGLLGAVAALEKPFPADALLAAVQRAVTPG